MCENMIQNEGFTHKMCEHGKCFEHSPEWEPVGSDQFLPDPRTVHYGFMWKKTKVIDRPEEENPKGLGAFCCGKNMLYYKKILAPVRCKKCGAEGRFKEEIELYFYCDCCHYQTKDSNECDC